MKHLITELRRVLDRIPLSEMYSMQGISKHTTTKGGETLICIYTDEPTRTLTKAQILGCAQHAPELPTEPTSEPAGTVYCYTDEDGFPCTDVLSRRLSPQEEREQQERLTYLDKGVCPDCRGHGQS